MNRAEILAEFRERVRDKVQPYAWSDTRCFRALSLGQDQFCKDTGFFRDTATYTIATVAGTAAYAIPARVIEVLKASIAGAWLKKFTGDAPLVDEGTPCAWQTDQDTGMVTLHPTPDAVYTVALHVWRKSKIAFLTSGDPEIPDDLQLAMVEWAAFLFYSDHDREIQDPVKAADHKRTYETYVPQGKQAFRRLCAGHGTFAPNPIYLV
ncbi:MAG: hypothetical protein A2Y38_12225 [Spirochaetes bacterium GWB1_59_5]|nr:MAG: hypothetical protein A2Y38_12225 [Spirochaetes bacterium GWB1_59_5]